MFIPAQKMNMESNLVKCQLPKNMPGTSNSIAVILRRRKKQNLRQSISKTEIGFVIKPWKKLASMLNTHCPRTMEENMIDMNMYIPEMSFNSVSPFVGMPWR